jgi:hypothetical protein
MSYPKSLTRRYNEAWQLLGKPVINTASRMYGYVCSLHVGISGSVQVGIQPAGNNDAFTADVELVQPLRAWLDDNKGLAALVEHPDFFLVDHKHNVRQEIPASVKLGEWHIPVIGGMAQAPVTSLSVFINGCVFYSGAFNPKEPDNMHVSFPDTLLVPGESDRATIRISSTHTGGPGHKVIRPD